jgi:hypothetical protein
MSKVGRIRSARHMAGMRDAFRMLLGLLEGKRSLETLCCRRQDNFVMELEINKYL